MSSSSSSPRHQHQLPPATTTFFIGLCSLLFVGQSIFANDAFLHKVTVCPRLVLYMNQYYRLITSALFHVNFMHIVMNMLSSVAICGVLEKQYMGSLRLLIIILWSILLTSSFHVLTAWLVWILFGNDQMMYQHGVGFSGVLFHLLVLECNNMNAQSAQRSIFGFVNVPSYLYPWVLLVVLQFIMPNLSFMGHLSGILVGTLQIYGVLDYLVLPSNAYLRRIEEQNSYVRRLTSSLPNFVPTPSSSSTNNGVYPLTLPSLCQQGSRESSFTTRSNVNVVWNGIRTVVTYIGYVLETIKVIIFGRGRQANQNIQLTGNSSGDGDGGWNTINDAFGNLDEDSDVDDDDNWNGLPPPSEQTRGGESTMV